LATIREQIIETVVAALAAAEAGGKNPPAKPGGLTVHRERTRPLDQDELPAIVVKEAKEGKPRPVGSTYKAPYVEREMFVALEFRAAGSSGVSPDQALDPLIAWGLYQVFGDESFGGIANGVEELETDWHSKEGDAALAAATTHLAIKYRTSRIDPSSRTS
jgi:hypothetical protein